MIAFLIAMGLGVIWLVVVVDPPPRPQGSEQSATFGRDGFCVLAGAVAGVLVYVLLRSTNRAVAYDPTLPSAIASILIAIACSGELAACLGRGRAVLIPTAIALQFVSVAVLVLFPFGFDHQSQWGLDFGHMLGLTATYVLAAIGGAAAAFLSGWKSAGMFQIAGIPVAGLLVVAADMARN